MKRMQLNDSVKRRRSSPIKTSTGSSDTTVRSTVAAFPVASSDELASDIPRSVSHVIGLPQPMSTSVSRTPSANSAFLQQNSDWKNQQRISGSWAPEGGCDQNSYEAHRQQQQMDRIPPTEMECNNSPKRCPSPWRNDEGGENGNAADKRSSLLTTAETRDSTVHLRHGGYPEVILDGGKPPAATVNSEKELDVEGQSIVTQGVMLIILVMC